MSYSALTKRAVEWLSRGALAFGFFSSQLLLAQTHGTVLIGSSTGPPGGAVTVPLTLVLDPGSSVDTLAVGVSVKPVGNAPALTAGELSFAPENGVPGPTLSTADPADIVLAWLSNLSFTNPGHAASGSARLGTITIAIPGTAANGQAYNIQITKIEGDVTGSNGTLTAVSLASLSAAIGPISTSVPLPPVIQPGGVLNAASYALRSAVAPGTIASLFGLNLAARTIMGTSIPPSTLLGGTQLLLNGNPVPLFFVSPGQINFQVPTELTGASAQATVVVNGVNSLNTTIPLITVNPGIFTITNTGTGQGAVLNSDYSVNSAQNPAPAGSAIMIYATGLGPTNPPVATGQGPGTSPPSVTVATPTVLVNGTSAQVLYSGLAPGFPGEYQVNAVIPPGTPPGSAIPLQILISGQSSNTAAIAVR